MKKLLFLVLLLGAINARAQFKDSLLIGQWQLDKVLVTFTGEEIAPPKKKSDFQFTLAFYEDSLVKFNLEINKCSNSYITPAKNQIKFLYYAECTLICCDKEFSELLTYEDCTTYYIKDNNILILVSEDRIYYFNRKAE